jgi:7-carboxy-7-deazaguanine synthase
MFGNNPIRGLSSEDGSILEVKKIFSTLQGEGLFAGYPSVFIRLGGCNLACKFCDTDFEDFHKMDVKEILNKVDYLSRGKIKLVVITGGEPFRQEISHLCDELISKNYDVQIETNGTLYRKINSKVNIVCSPKPTENGYSKIREDLLSRINALKFLVSKYHKNYDFVPDVGQSKYNIPVYVQAIDEYDEIKNRMNLDYAIEIAKNNCYRLSVQIHKYIGVE